MPHKYPSVNNEIINTAKTKIIATNVCDDCNASKNKHIVYAVISTTEDKIISFMIEFVFLYSLFYSIIFVINN